MKMADVVAASALMGAPSRVHVVMLVDNPCTNDSRVIKEAEALSSRRFQVTVVCRRTGDLPTFESRGGVVYYRVSPAPPKGIGAEQPVAGWHAASRSLGWQIFQALAPPVLTVRAVLRILSPFCPQVVPAHPQIRAGRPAALGPGLPARQNCAALRPHRPPAPCPPRVNAPRQADTPPDLLVRRGQLQGSGHTSPACARAGHHPRP